MNSPPPPGSGAFPPVDPAVLDHSQNTGPAIGVATLCIVITTTAVALRMYTRCFLLKRVGADDYMALASLAGVFAVAGTLIEHTKYGLGSHIWDVVQDPKGLEGFFHLFYLGIVFYNITLFFIKLSLVLQYFPIIRPVPRYRMVFFVVATFVVAWSIGMTFTMILICVPAQGYWDKSVPAKCLTDQTVQLASAVGNIVTDVILLVLPLPVVWRLGLVTRQKVVLTCLFCLGFVAAIISLLRVSFIFSPRTELDFTRDAVDIVCWTLAEITTGTLCASLITLRPLVSRVLPEFGTFRSARRAMTPGASQKLHDFTLSSLSTVKRRGDQQASKSPGLASPDSILPSPQPFYAGETGFEHTKSLVLVIQGHSQMSLDDDQPSHGGATGRVSSCDEDLPSQPDYSQEREGLHFDANELAGLEPVASPHPRTNSTLSSSMSTHSTSAVQTTELRYPPIYHSRDTSN